jgi:hypothetical protein
LPDQITERDAALARRILERSPLGRSEPQPNGLTACALLLPRGEEGRFRLHFIYPEIP